MDPMEELEYQLASRRTTRIILSRARARVAEAEKHVEMLESRKLAVVNPYLPRPVLTETEAAEWEGLDNVERTRLTDQAIADARTELDAARQALERIRRGG